MRVLLVDDENLARARLRTLLGDCPSPKAVVQAEAANAVQAMELLQRQVFDVALVDVHMPGADGLAFGKVLRSLPNPPALVFVTAYLEHAVQAFELEAVDYLTKPVRLERLQAALLKVERHVSQKATQPQWIEPEECVVIHERGRTERVSLQQVIYFKAEQKYITVRTAERSYILEGSLNELEEKYADRYLRVHRNALVARGAMRSLEKHFDPEDGEGWAVHMHGTSDVVNVSRRQLAAVRELVRR
ncbi:response regulator transcription factor [Rhodoferax aquaticus]|uniref:Response regulator transcription factor n=1 Tax=Rhodoferax aquaticus TaxID=2527691 RepID=A0A515EW01_9BURK|nr:response regulator transcription factor [Rhodoferax aquaticus]